MSDCIFCKIAAGEIPSTKVYEDEKVLAFKDLEPQAPFHVLVIPKEHLASAADITGDNSELISAVFEAVAKIAKQENLTDGFRVVTNSGKFGRQSVNHLHFHMLSGRELDTKMG